MDQFENLTQSHMEAQQNAALYKAQALANYNYENQQVESMNAVHEAQFMGLFRKLRSERARLTALAQLATLVKLDGGVA